MPASLTEEELARLDVNVRVCQRSRMPMTVLPTEQAEKLLASARAVRNGIAKCDEIELTPGFDQVSTSRRGAARQIREAITATAEPTAEEDDHG